MDVPLSSVTVSSLDLKLPIFRIEPAGCGRNLKKIAINERRLPREARWYLGCSDFLVVQLSRMPDYAGPLDGWARR